jgi:hypothetical protein
MNPICVTVTPALTLPLGNQNLRSFVESGYSHISINPDHQMTQAEFDKVIDRYANQELFEQIDGRWKPRFLVE